MLEACICSILCLSVCLPFGGRILQSIFGHDRFNCGSIEKEKHRKIEALFLYLKKDRIMFIKRDHG
jgi:hypothetical protein